MEDKQTFGNLLKKLRKEENLTAEELADKAGIDRTYITKIETDDKLPSVAIMEKIAKVLNDEDLFKEYLKIKYPMVYDRIKPFDIFLSAKMSSIVDEIGKDNMTIKDTEELERKIKRYDTISKRAKIQLKKITKKLRELESL